jgi:hypothetical protein
VRAVVEALKAQGGILADSVRPASNGHAPRGDLARRAAQGPRAAAHQEDYELLLELIIEGSRLHYGLPRFVRTGDPDLALLLGDQLYALGLAHLAALGDLEAVSELADVISLVAQAHAASDPELADAIWRAGASAIGWGGDEGYATAKALVRGQQPGAREALSRVTAPALRDARPA